MNVNIEIIRAIPAFSCTFFSLSFIRILIISIFLEVFGAEGFCGNNVKAVVRLVVLKKHCNFSNVPTKISFFWYVFKIDLKVENLE